LRDLDCAQHLVAVLVQDRHGVLIDHEVYRVAVGGQHGIAVPVDEVLASQHPLLGWPVQRDPEASVVEVMESSPACSRPRPLGGGGLGCARLSLEQAGSA
jgi:hypothetical protein